MYSIIECTDYTLVHYCSVTRETASVSCAGTIIRRGCASNSVISVTIVIISNRYFDLFLLLMYSTKVIMY